MSEFESEKYLLVFIGFHLNYKLNSGAGPRKAKVEQSISTSSTNSTLSFGIRSATAGYKSPSVNFIGSS